MEGPRGTRDHPISTKDMQNRCPRMAAYQQVPRNEGMTGLNSVVTCSSGLDSAPGSQRERVPMYSDLTEGESVGV